MIKKCRPKSFALSYQLIVSLNPDVMAGSEWSIARNKIMGHAVVEKVLGGVM